MNLLPHTLLYLVLQFLSASAQTRLQLPLNAVSQFSSGNGPYVIPPAEQVIISVAACSQTTDVRFLISNENGSATPSISDPGVGEIFLSSGQGQFTGAFENGGVVVVVGTGSFEIALSTTGRPMHALATDLPLFGDSTSNQAIVFSPPLFRLEVPGPTYPNYTLSPVDIPQDGRPTTTPNYTLSLFPTASIQGSYPWSGCFLSRQLDSDVNVNQSLWLRDEQGWRSQFLLGGLTPSTNYTAFLLESSNIVRGPIYFATKSAAFPCPLVADLPYCPGVSYAMPLPPPPNNAEIYTGDTLPSGLSDPLRSYLTNFTVTLGSFPCGRDVYSPLVTCLDCQREYRKWLCAISLPRCSEPSPGNPNGFTAVAPEPTVTGLSATKNQDQQVLSALQPYQTSTPPRNSALPQFTSSYQMLLPCIETCTAVDRACPAFIGFKCPTAQFNGAASYGIGYIDSADGDEKKGLTGEAQDRWGNVWCQLG